MTNLAKKYMKRLLLTQLLEWKQQSDRLPLLIRGARQVGKTYLIEEFGRQYYPEVFKVNFEQQREYLACFETLYPQKILELLFALSGRSITPGKTLLFLDEIQECPMALMALRYFYEQVPDLHIIAAGSLLEFTMRKPDFRMPVGRVQSLYMKPLSFLEFLWASDRTSLVDYITKVTVRDGVEPVIHQQLLGMLREYLVLGGMPAVLKNYFQSQSLEQSQIRQRVILENYRSDFGKYASQTDVKYLQTLFDKSVGLVGKHFKYSEIDPHMHSRDLKRALVDLLDAGIVYTCHPTAASGLPLIPRNEKRFKLFFLDVGLVNNVTRLGAQTLLNSQLVLLHEGVLAEQFVAQELLAYASAYQKEQLFYWERAQRTSTAEVDFVVAADATILPIEVKAGAGGRLRSLQILLDERSLNVGVQISQKALSFDKRVLSVPLYLISEIPRLIKQI